MSEKSHTVEIDEKELKSIIAEAVREGKETMDEEKKKVEENKAKLETEAKALQTLIDEGVKSALAKIVEPSKMQFPGVIKEKGEGKRSFVEVLKGIRYKNDYLLKKYDMIAVNDKDEKIMIEGVGAQGGFLVPAEFVQQIIDESLSYEVVKPLCTTVPMSGLTKTWPELVSGSIAYWIDENGAKTESTPVWRQLTLQNYKCCAMVKVSDEELEDSNPSADSFLSSNFASVIGNAVDRAYLVGVGGVGDPITGITNLAGIGNTPAGVQLTFDDIIDAMTATMTAGAQNLSFIVHPRDIGTLMKLRGADGQYIWSNPGLGGAFGSIYGRPVYIDGNIPTTLGVGGNQSLMLVGDFKKVYIGDKGGLVISNGLDGEDFSHDRSTFRAVIRTGSVMAISARPKINVITGINP